MADPLEPLGRRERRHWGSVYVRGLMLDGERKSIEPMAARLPEGNVQAMQQLIGQSPWLWAPVWQRLAQRMTAELRPDPVWVIDDTGFPKQGHHSVGVARQYSGTLGKTANCQVAVSLHQTAGEESTILDWRLYLPESWTQDPERRAAAGIPAEVKFQTKWELALELIDEAQKWGLRSGWCWRTPVTGKSQNIAGAGDSPTPLCGGHPFDFGGVDEAASHPQTESPRAGPSAECLSLRPAAARHRPGGGAKGPRVEASALARGQQRLARVPLPCLPRATLAWIPRGPTPAQGGLAAGGMASAARKNPPNTFSATCRSTTHLRRLVRIVKARWKIGQDYQQLKEKVGWIITKAAVGQVGIIMSRWLCWRMPS